MKTLRDARAAAAGLVLTALVGLPFVAGCAVHAHPAPAAHHHGAVRVTVAKGHVHGVRCGHYRHGRHWYHVRGHVHGARCGHLHVGGVWVLRR